MNRFESKIIEGKARKKKKCLNRKNELAQYRLKKKTDTHSKEEDEN